MAIPKKRAYKRNATEVSFECNKKNKKGDKVEKKAYDEADDATKKRAFKRNATEVSFECNKKNKKGDKVEKKAYDETDDATKKRAFKRNATQVSFECNKKKKRGDKVEEIAYDDTDDETDYESDGDTLTTNQTTPTQSTRSLRGKTRLHDLAIVRSRGELKDVRLNDCGVPIGKESNQLQSLIGFLAREVNITYDTWKHIPKKEKDVIWETVKLSFNVDPKWMSRCFKSANDKWRQHKNKLTDYIYARIDTPEVNTPPSEYPQITPAQWKTFVTSRTSPGFKALREKQQQRRAQIIHPYRLSRKGYANHASENPGLLCDDPEINQAILWVEGRKTKEGIHKGDDLKDKVTKIEEFIAKKKTGSLDVEEMGGTILENALDSQEHHGRLRGIGGHVTQTVYFKVPRGREHDKELCMRQQQEIMEQKKRNALQDERIAKLEAIIFKTQCHNVDNADIDEKGSCSVQVKVEMNPDTPQTQHKDDVIVNLGEDHIDMPVPDVQLLKKNEHLQGKLVALSVESGTGIAAYGTVVKVFEVSDDYSGDCVRVAIDEALDEHAPLPIPTSESHFIGDAVGSHVTWPTHLLVEKDEKPKVKKTQSKKQSQMDYSCIPTSLRMVHLYCKEVLKNTGTIVIRLDKEVFDKERKLYILLEDVELFCKLVPISYNCIVVYIWHIYNKLRSSKRIDKFKFVDPCNVGHIPSTKKDEKRKQKRIDTRAQYLAARLISTLENQIVLAPCNTGNHWILTVIDPHKGQVGLLDSVYLGNHDGDWKKVVDLALSMFNAKIGKEKQEPSWIVIKGPKQPDCYQCGFYVMRYMKEIIELESSDTISAIKASLSSETKRKYSDVEINEVREE